jgi:hypothetical protein
MFWQLYYFSVIINIIINYVYSNSVAWMFLVITLFLGVCAIIEFHYNK